jgi:hypothetical protein
MKRGISPLIAVTLGVVVWMPVITLAQVNSGSTGSDGALDFSGISQTTNIVINMADHPTGIYQYTYVNIPTNVTVAFSPNASNTPVVWLVQSNVVINGAVNLQGQIGGNQGQGNEAGGVGGPGAYEGGVGGNVSTAGQGPGGGTVGSNAFGGGGTYLYGNSFLIPLLGGSGGGGSTYGAGGGGGGGAILIAASSSIQLNGTVNVSGGLGGYIWDPSYGNGGGGGSGGAIRLVASRIFGNGSVKAAGSNSGGGNGRIRFDTYENDFAGNISGTFTQGSQFVIIPILGQLPQLTVTSVGGVAVSASPTGVLSTPDAVISAQQTNPVPIVVQCSNIPLNTPITVSVTPMNGSPVSAMGYNSTGTLASSIATISIVMPRGGGLIYATAATSN